MTELMRLIVLLVLVATAVTALASGYMWYGDEQRRIVRGLTKVLKGRPDALLIARGRGRGVALRLANRSVAVTWDKGAWCLVYRLNELMGAELLIDGAVMARTYRGEPRRSLERVSGAAGEVSFRLIFDDPQHPDFELELWREGDERRDQVASPGAAVQEANRWIASVESLFRRTAEAHAAPAPQAAAEPPEAPPSPPPPRAPPEPDLFEDIPEPDKDN